MLKWGVSENMNLALSGLSNVFHRTETSGSLAGNMYTSTLVRGMGQNLKETVRCRAYVDNTFNSLTSILAKAVSQGKSAKK